MPSEVGNMSLLTLKKYTSRWIRYENEKEK